MLFVNIVLSLALFLAELLEHSLFFFFLFDFFDFVNADVEFCFGSDRACDKALRLFFHLFFVAVAALLFLDCADDCVHDYAKDKSGCNGSDGDGLVNRTLSVR